MVTENPIPQGPTPSETPQQPDAQVAPAGTSLRERFPRLTKPFTIGAASLAAVAAIGGGIVLYNHNHDGNDKTLTSESAKPREYFVTPDIKEVNKELSQAMAELGPQIKELAQDDVTGGQPSLESWKLNEGDKPRFLASNSFDAIANPPFANDGNKNVGSYYVFANFSNTSGHEYYRALEVTSEIHEHKTHTTHERHQSVNVSYKNKISIIHRDNGNYEIESYEYTEDGKSTGGEKSTYGTSPETTLTKAEVTDAIAKLRTGIAAIKDRTPLPPAVPAK